MFPIHEIRDIGSKNECSISNLNNGNHITEYKDFNVTRLSVSEKEIIAVSFQFL